MSSFGTRLQGLRGRADLTQEQMAKIFKISKSAIGMYERDEREPSFEFVKQVSDYFEVSIDYLITGSDPSLDSKTDPEWQELYKRVVEKGIDLQIKGMMLRATNNDLNRDQLEAIERMMDVMKADDAMRNKQRNDG